MIPLAAGLLLAAVTPAPCGSPGRAPAVLSVWSGFHPEEPGFRHPLGLSSDPDGRILILDSGGGRILRFDASGHGDAAWDLPKSPEDRGGLPATAFAVTREALFVHSPLAGGILVLDGRGDLRTRLPYQCPVNGLAADRLDQVYVSGSEVGSGYGSGPAVWKLNRRGEALLHWQVPEAGPLAAAPDGSLWGVTRAWEGGPWVVRHWTPFGETLSDWTLGDLARGEIAAIAVDDRGHVFVAARNCGLVSEFDRQGREMRRWTSAGPGAVPLQEPAGLALDPEGHLYVADWPRHRIVKYDPETRR